MREIFGNDAAPSIGPKFNFRHGSSVYANLRRVPRTRSQTVV
jgi:hypothetical protein